MHFFAADIHLSPNHPRRTVRFYEFLQLVKNHGQTLYLLGDIFDLWLGDDIGGDFGKEIQTKLREVAGGGVKVYLQHGNRDFLLGKQFADGAGCQLINDNYTIKNINGGILLTHGDTLAADNNYKIYRAIVRNSLIKGLFLSCPAGLRKSIATKLRKTSDKTRHRPKVEPSAAQQLLKMHNCQTLIHGHLHTPEDQQWQSDNHNYRRLCLPAWEGGGGGYARIAKDDNGAARLELTDNIVR